MTKEQEAAFLEYEDVKINIKQSEARLEELKEIIKPCIKEDEEINGNKGIFTLKKRDKWKFSESTTKKAEELKAIQEDEIAKGIAVSSPTIYINYEINKG